MGTTAHVLVQSATGGDEPRHLDEVQAYVEHLERLWSRFLPMSELTRVNQHSRVPVPVSRPTFDLIQLAVDSWRASDGLFDPSVGTAMLQCGYDRTFSELSHDAISGRTSTATAVLAPTSGCAGIELDEASLTVTLPLDVQLDLGGIGKGRAADLVANRLQDNGVETACINLGGDLRCIGGHALDGGWGIDVEHPFDATRSIAVLGLTEGAVATSARTRRCWATPRGTMHHLVDPTTGQPADTGLAQVTVLAAEAAAAEVLAKSAYLAGPVSGRELIEASGAAALLVTDVGDVMEAGPIGRFRR
jgi:thiamine biosynthesis lipoprotein